MKNGVSFQQSTEIILLYGQCQRYARRTAAMFNDTYSNNLSLIYLFVLVAKFSETDCVIKKKRIDQRVFNIAA